MAGPDAAPAVSSSSMATVIVTDLRSEDQLWSAEFGETAEGRYSEFLAMYSEVAIDTGVGRSPEEKLEFVRSHSHQAQLLVVLTIQRSGSSERVSPSQFLESVSEIDARQKLLIHCEVCDEDSDETPSELGVDCSSENFESKFPSTYFAYISDSEERIQQFVGKLVAEKQRLWFMKDIAQIMVQDMHEFADVLVTANGLGGEEFTCGHRVDEFENSDDLIGSAFQAQKPNLLKLDKAAAAEDPFYHHEIKKGARPLALIIDNVEVAGNSRRCSSLADRLNLRELLTAMQFKVHECVQQTADEVLAKVGLFASADSHGPSCVVAVLSEMTDDGTLECRGSEPVNPEAVLRILHGDDCKMKDKPRLVIFHAWVRSEEGEEEEEEKDLIRDSHALTTLGKVLGCPRLVDAYHPRRGLIVANAITPADPSAGKGSRFVLALCRTFYRFAAKEDVAAMISRVNHIVTQGFQDDEAELEDAGSRGISCPAAVWRVQTDRRLFLVNTSRRTGSGSGSRSIRTKGKNNQPADDDPGIQTAITGRAVVIVGHSDAGIHGAAQDAYAFLSCCGFEVTTEFVEDSGPISLLHGMRGGTAVALIVKKSADSLQEIADRVKLCGAKDKLLIFCHGSDGEVPEVVEVEESPGFGLVLRSGTSAEIAEFIRHLTAKFVEKYHPDAPPEHRSSAGVGEILRDVGVRCSGVRQDEIRELRATQKREFTADGTRLECNFLLREFTQLNQEYSFLRQLGNLRHLQLRNTEDVIPHYNWDINSTPRALIIANFVYEHQSNLGQAIFECNNLLDVFSRMGFRVTLRMNLTSQRMEEAVRDFANADDHGRCCVLVVMSHGAMGAIVGVDACGRSTSEETLLSFMRRGAHIANKPKLVLFQSCRSGDLPLDGPEPLIYPDEPSIPSNMVVGYATSPYCDAYGDFFFSALCFVLYERAWRQDLVSMLPIVNHVMMEAYDQYYDDDPEGTSLLAEWRVETDKLFYLVGAGTDCPEAADTAGESDASDV